MEVSRKYSLYQEEIKKIIAYERELAGGDMADQ
jgi:hypothetical protein